VGNIGPKPLAANCSSAGRRPFFSGRPTNCPYTAEQPFFVGTQMHTSSSGMNTHPPPAVMLATISARPNLVSNHLAVGLFLLQSMTIHTSPHRQPADLDRHGATLVRLIAPSRRT